MKIERYLDHSVLVPEMTDEEVKAAIQDGIDHQVRTVCVRPCDIILAKEMCAGTETGVCCVLDFPHGSGGAEAKEALAQIYAGQGVDEIDMVMNYGFARSGQWEKVEDEIARVVKAAHNHNVLVKVIFETSKLNEDQVRQATLSSMKAGADFVKTSTGFNGEGAKESDVEIMLKTADGKIKVKPSGGIRDYQRAKLFADMGVDRIGVGCNSTKIIASGAEAKGDESGY